MRTLRGRELQDKISDFYCDLLQVVHADFFENLSNDCKRDTLIEIFEELEMESENAES